MKPENLKCPDCDGEMISRLNSKTEQRFWGCKSFPKCKGTRDTDGLSKQDREDDKEYRDKHKPLFPYKHER